MATLDRLMNILIAKRKKAELQTAESFLSMAAESLYPEKFAYLEDEIIDALRCNRLHPIRPAHLLPGTTKTMGQNLSDSKTNEGMSDAVGSKK